VHVVSFHFCSLTRWCNGQILLLLVAIQLCLVAAFAPVVAPSLRAIGKSSLTSVCGDKGKGEKPKKPKQVALPSLSPPTTPTSRVFFVAAAGEFISDSGMVLLVGVPEQILR